MTDKKLSRTYIIFAILLVIITSIGLFAISLFDINRKYKEIGIRKINGATMGHIMSLLFRKYFLMLIVSFIVSIPISLWLIKLYTENYALKAPIGIGVFVVAFLIVGIVSLLTILYQTWRISIAKPIEVLKVE